MSISKDDTYLYNVVLDMHNDTRADPILKEATSNHGDHHHIMKRSHVPTRATPCVTDEEK